MSLEETPTTKSTNPKVINITKNNDTSVIYTVPDGRVFEGYVRGSSTQYYFSVAGLSSNSADFKDRLTLPAGTVIKGGSNNNVLILGIERDLV